MGPGKVGSIMEHMVQPSVQTWKRIKTDQTYTEAYTNGSENIYVTIFFKMTEEQHM